jgi:hypothetical protein
MDISNDVVVCVNVMKTPTNVEIYTFGDETECEIEKTFLTQTKKINSEKICIANKKIFQDDNVITICNKLANELKVKPNEIYMYYKKKITSDNYMYIMSSFVESVFREYPLITIVDVNRLIHITFQLKLNFDEQFPFPWNNVTDMIRKDVFIKELKNKYELFNKQYMYVPISQTIYDITRKKERSKKTTICFAINPFLAMFNDDDVLSIEHIVIEHNTFRDLISFKENVLDEFFVVLKDDLNQYFEKHSKSNKDKILDLYYSYPDKQFDYYKDIDCIKSFVYNYDVSSSIKNQTINIHKVIIQSIQVILDKTYNIIKVFNTLPISAQIPFMVITKRDNTKLFRILQTDIDKVVDTNTYEQWIENEYKSKTIWKDNSFDIIVIKFLFNTTNYATLLFRGDGYFHIIFTIDKKNNNFKTIEKYLDTINTLLTKQNEIPKIILDINCKLKDYETKTKVLSNTELLNKKLFIQRLKSSVFFDFLKESANGILNIKYKCVSNYKNIDEIMEFIYQIYTPTLKDEEIIEQIEKEFSLTKEKANEVWQEKKTLLNEYIIKNVNTGVKVKVEIKDKLIANFEISQIQNIEYHDNILHALIITLLSNVDDKNINIKPNKLETIEEFNDDLSSNTSFHNFTFESDDYDEFDEYDDNDDDDDDDDFDDLMDFNINIEDDSIEVKSKPTTDDITSSLLDDPEKYKDIQQYDKKNPGKETKAYRAYISTVMLKEGLQKADPTLFLNNYAKHCQSVDRRQPVVITQEEKDYIDEHHEGSYAGYRNHGSTEELKEKNIYICPLVWCPIGKISMTYKEYLENDKKCPTKYSETPIVLISKKDQKKYNGKEDELKKYPNLVDPNKDGTQMVCCGLKKETTKVTTKYVDDRYIQKLIGKRVGIGRLATLPSFLNDFMNDGKTLEDCSGNRNDKNDGCFLRYGILGENEEQPALNMLMETINNNNVTTVKKLIKFIKENLKVDEYLLLNSGNTMKTYVPSDTTKNYPKFREKFLNNTRYVDKMNLHDVRQYIEDNETIDFNDNTYINMVVKREMMIYESYKNYLKYLSDKSVLKEIEEVVNLLRLKWFNPQNIYYIFIDVSDETNIQLLCNKYYEPETIRNNDKIHIILKNGEYYEQVVRLEKSFNIHPPFNSKEKSIKELVTIYKDNCRRMNFNEIGNQVYDTLQSNYSNINYVINYNLKLVGFHIEKEKLYCPLPSPENINNVSDDMKIIFFDALPKCKTKQFEELIDIHSFYENKANIDFDKDHDYLKVFVGFEEQIKNQYDIEFVKQYNQSIKQLLPQISEKDQLTISLIRHELNPYPIDDKIDDIKNVISKLCSFSDCEDYLDKFSKDIYFQGIDSVQQAIYTDVIINDDENVYSSTFHDKIDILNHYYYSKNPYKNVKNSLEDLSNYKKINDLIWNAENASKMNVPRVTIEEEKIYRILKSNMFVIDLPLKKAFKLIDPFFDAKAFKENTIQWLGEYYTTEEQKEHVCEILNFYQANTIVHEESEKIKKPESILIRNQDEFMSLATNPQYSMGIYECMQYAKTLKVGLIMFVRSNKNPKYPYIMTVSKSMSNMQVLIENNESNKYIFIYANKRDNIIYNQYNLKVRLIANVNAYDDNDIQLIHELSNPKLFKISIKDVEKKLNYILYKNNLPTSIKWLKSKLI